jgi:maltooligosyltrehalose trehalohydrolase
MPQTPMLFQGQEFAASTPFVYFGDAQSEIAALMDQGRKDFLSQFPSLATAAMQSLLPRLNDPASFLRSKLDPAQRHRHAEAYALHHDLLRLRSQDGVLGDAGEGRIEGAVLGPSAFVLRYFSRGGDDRILIVNLGAELELVPASEPLLAPPADALWVLRFSSEDPRYGGGGIVPMAPEENWRLTGHSAIVMSPIKRHARLDEHPAAHGELPL